MSKIITHVWAWLQLFRAPNLFTVPGDPVAGFLLAQLTAGTSAPFSHVTAAASASVLLYMAGLALNDWADRHEDARERPERPIPGGRLNASTVLVVTTCLAVAAISIVAFFCGKPAALAATLLLAMIVLYNLAAKHIRILGPLIMGSCRGLSLLLGAVASGWLPNSPDILLIASAALTFYVAALTAIAADETGNAPVGFKRWLPALVTLATISTISTVGGPVQIPFVLMMTILTGWCLYHGHKLKTSPIKNSVKGFILGLFVFQAALCFLSGQTGIVAACAILMALPISIALARRFYVT